MYVPGGVTVLEALYILDEAIGTFHTKYSKVKLYSFVNGGAVPGKSISRSS